MLPKIIALMVRRARLPPISDGDHPARFAVRRPPACPRRRRAPPTARPSPAPSGRQGEARLDRGDERGEGARLVHVAARDGVCPADDPRRGRRQVAVQRRPRRDDHAARAALPRPDVDLAHRRPPGRRRPHVGHEGRGAPPWPPPRPRPSSSSLPRRSPPLPSPRLAGQGRGDAGDEGRVRDDDEQGHQGLRPRDHRLHPRADQGRRDRPQARGRDLRPGDLLVGARGDGAAPQARLRRADHSIKRNCARIVENMSKVPWRRPPLPAPLLPPSPLPPLRPLTPPSPSPSTAARRRPVRGGAVHPAPPPRPRALQGGGLRPRVPRGVREGVRAAQEDRRAAAGVEAVRGRHRARRAQGEGEGRRGDPQVLGRRRALALRPQEPEGRRLDRGAHAVHQGRRDHAPAREVLDARQGRGGEGGGRRRRAAVRLPVLARVRQQGAAQPDDPQAQARLPVRPVRQERLGQDVAHARDRQPAGRGLPAALGAAHDVRRDRRAGRLGDAGDRLRRPPPGPQGAWHHVRHGEGEAARSASPSTTRGWRPPRSRSRWAASRAAGA